MLGGSRRSKPINGTMPVRTRQETVEARLSIRWGVVLQPTKPPLDVIIPARCRAAPRAELLT